MRTAVIINLSSIAAPIVLRVPSASIAFTGARLLSAFNGEVASVIGPDGEYWSASTFRSPANPHGWMTAPFRRMPQVQSVDHSLTSVT